MSPTGSLLAVFEKVVEAPGIRSSLEEVAHGGQALSCYSTAPFPVHTLLPKCSFKKEK